MTRPTPTSRDFVAAMNERFAAIAGWSFDHRWIVLLLCCAAIFGAAKLSGLARVDASYESYFDPQDPIYLAYEQYRDDFGSDEVSYILYAAPEAEHGPWNLDVMRRVLELTEALEDEVPFIYEVKSLANAELTVGVADGIEIRELADDFPETQEELLALRDQYLAKPMLVGGLVSADATHAAITIEMDRSSTDPLEDIRHDTTLSEAEGLNALENLYPQVTDDAIAAILARPEYADIVFRHTGDVPFNAVYNRIIEEETGFLFMMTCLVIGVILAVCFRSTVGVLAPLAVVSLSMMFSMALIGALGWMIDLSFSSVPTLLTAIGIAHSVHILNGFRMKLRELGNRREALVQTVRLVGTPCLLTSLTTAAGFAAMSFVPIKSIAHMGVYSAFGVLAAFFLSLTLLMALLSFDPMAFLRRVTGAGEPAQPMHTPAASPNADVGRQRVRAALDAIAAFDIRHRRAILAGFALLFVASFVGMTRIVADSNWLDDFSDEVPLKVDAEYVDEVMGGSTNIIYVFDAGEPDAIKEPAVLREMERVQEIAEKHDLVRKSYSLVDILKDLNQAFHEGDPAYYVIPETRELVAQYLLLYETSGGEEAEELVSSDYQRASLEFRLAIAPTSHTADLVAAIDAELEREPLEAATASLTGIGALWLILLDYIVSSQITGFLLAFCVIAVMMVTVFRSFSVGLISMVPNLTPIAFVLGLMGVLGIYLDYSKVSIAAVAIGIAVDDTIHLMSRYRFEFRRLGNYREALHAALGDVGRALFITSIALVCGFSVFALSIQPTQAMFGLLLSVTIVTALVADLLLMPALVLTFEPFGPEGERVRAPEALREAA